jgi:hypothetical protein
VVSISRRPAALPSNGALRRDGRARARASSGASSARCRTRSSFRPPTRGFLPRQRRHERVLFNACTASSGRAPSRPDVALRKAARAAAGPCALLGTGAGRSSASACVRGSAPLRSSCAVPALLKGNEPKRLIEAAVDEFGGPGAEAHARPGARVRGVPGRGEGERALGARRWSVSWPSFLDWSAVLLPHGGPSSARVASRYSAGAQPHLVAALHWRRTGVAGRGGTGVPDRLRHPLARFAASSCRRTRGPCSRTAPPRPTPPARSPSSS